MNKQFYLTKSSIATTTERWIISPCTTARTAPGKFRTPLQHVLNDELYAFVPQQERRPGKFRTPPQHVLKD